MYIAKSIKFSGKLLNALTIAMLLLAGVSVTPAFADVIFATNWTAVPSGVDGGTTGPYTIPEATFSCGAGSNRLLVAVVTAEYGLPGEAIAVTATKGAGVNFTPVVSTPTQSRVGVWIGYLNEAQISGNTNDIVITETAPGDDWTGSRIHLACFSGVNQNAPIVSNGTDNSNSAIADFANTTPWNFSVDAINGGVVIYAGSNSNPNAAFTPPTGYTEAFDGLGGVPTIQHRSTVGYKLVTATGSETGTISWTNNAWHALAVVSINPAVPPTITSANNTTFTVLSAGTFTITTTGAPTPSITYTGSLPSGVSLVDNGDGTATISGTAASGTVGSYPITITASNSALPDATQNFTLNVIKADQTINVTTSAPSSASNGSTFNVAATATSGLTVAITTSGVCSGSGNGSATVTITSGTGTCTVHYNQAGNADYNAAAEVTEDVAATEGPAFTSVDNTTFGINSFGTFTITTSGNPTPTISHTAGALPTGVSFVDNGDGTATLSGTPALGTAGDYTLQLEAANGILPDAIQVFTLTVASGPIVVPNGIGSVADTGDGHLDEFEVATVDVTQLLATFNKDVLNVSSSDPDYGDSVINPANYILVRDNGDGIQTFTCNVEAQGGGVTGGDIVISVDTITYSNGGGSGPFVATLNINGGTPLPDGLYRLIICGTTSIVDLNGIPLAGDGTTEGTDFTRNFRISTPSGGDGPRASALPATGFPKGRVTILPPQPAQKAYASTDMLLEIPTLNQKMTIVGVPQSAESWDVTWLGNSAGYLAGSAYPTWSGNTVITGHVWDAYNKPGPFENLRALKYGDQIKIHAWGQEYTYEVRESRLVTSKKVDTVFQHEELDWVTLLSCEFYNPINGNYLFRRVVRAVLVSVK